MNYEQLDLTRSSQKEYARYYYGLGLNISPNTTRKRLAFQGGYFYKQPFKSTVNYAYIYGVDMKIYEHNDYRPSFKTGIGIELARNRQNPFMIILEYYNGHLPYSTLEYQLVQLYGLGIYFNP